MPIFSFISHSVWTCPLSTRYSSLKAIFRSFPAADGQIGGHMDIIFAFLNRIFHYLSFDVSHDHKKKWKIFWDEYPHLRPCGRGGQSAPTSIFFKSKKYRLQDPCMPIFTFLGLKVWICSPPPSDNGLSRIPPFKIDFLP